MSEIPSRPAVGVGAVVWKEDAVLLIQRGKDPGKGRWSLPGGHQEFGETIREAVVREVLEETGLVVEVGELIDVVDAIFSSENDGDGRHFTLIDFECSWRGGDPVAGDDAVDARWFDARALENLGMWPETLRIISENRQARLARSSFEYVRLGEFTWNLMREPEAITRHLKSWLKKEWLLDQKEFPDQPWTPEWLETLNSARFELAAINLADIKVRNDLMEYDNGTFNFQRSLTERAKEREASMLRGISIEPLVVNGSDFQLMDGHTRYQVLAKCDQTRVFVYIGQSAS